MTLKIASLILYFPIIVLVFSVGQLKIFFSCYIMCILNFGGNLKFYEIHLVNNFEGDLTENTNSLKFSA